MRRGFWIAGELAALAVMVLALAAWMVFSASGAQALLAVAQWASGGALRVTQAQGALAGTFSAQRLQWRATGQPGIVITGLQWQFNLRDARFDKLAADAVEVQLADTPSAGPPAQLGVPVNVTVQALNIGTLTLRSATSTSSGSITLQQISGSLALGPLTHRWDLQARYQQLQAQLRGSIATGAPFACEASASLQPVDAQAAPLNWTAQVSARGPLTELPLQAQVTAQGQSLSVQTVLTPWQPQAVSQVAIRAQGFDLAPLDSQAPHTVLTGRVDATLHSGAPLQLQVDLRNDAPGPWNQRRLPITLLRAQGSGARDAGRFDTLQAELPGGGKLQGRVQWKAAAQGGTDWQAELQGQGVQPHRLDSRVLPMQLNGQLALQGRSGGIAAAPLQLRADVHGQVEDPRVAKRSVQLQANASVGERLITVRKLLARSGESTAQVSGELNDWRGARRFKLQAQLERFAPEAWLRWPHRAVVNATLKAEGNWPAAQHLPQALQADLQWQDSQLDGQPTSGQADLSLQPPAMRGGATRWASSGTLALAGQQARWSGRYGNDGDSVQLDVQAPEVERLAALAALAGVKLPPLQASLQAQLRSTQTASGPQFAWTLQAKQLRLGSVHATQLQASGSAGLRNGDRIVADAALQGLDTAHATGVQMQAQLRGTWAAHTLTLRTQGQVGQHPVQFELDAQGALSGDLPQPTRWQGQGAAVVLENGLAWARTQTLSAVVEQPFSAAPPFAFHASLQDLAAAPLLRRATGAPESGDGWVGDLLMGVDVDIARNMRGRDGMHADLHVYRKRGDLGLAEAGRNEMFGMQQVDVQLRGAQGQWRFTHAVVGERIGSITAQATWALPAAQWLPQPATPLTASLDLQVSNMDVWSAALPPGWRLGGRMQGSVNVKGSFGSLRGEGRLQADGLNVRNLLQGVDYQDGSARLVWAGDRLRLEALQLKAGDGTLHGSGEMDFEQAPFRAQAQLTLSRFRLLSRVDRRVTGSGELQLSANGRAAQLQGKLRVDDGLIDISRSEAPSLGDDVVVRRSAQDQDRARAAQGQPLALNVEVDLGDALQLRGRGLDTRLAGTLRLTNPQGRLAAQGTLRAVDGSYTAYGQRLSIERGTLRFNGPVNAPLLDVLATRRGIDNEQQRVGVSVTGSALNPRVRLYADPDMSDTEKLAYLVSGRGYSTLGRDDAALVQRAAFALLQGEGGGPSGLLQSAGLDNFSVEQRANGDVKSTVVSVGKQISQRVYVGYERGLNATTGVFQLIYRLSQRFTLRAQSGDSAGADLIWQWSWN